MFDFLKELLSAGALTTEDFAYLSEKPNLTELSLNELDQISAGAAHCQGGGGWLSV